MPGGREALSTRTLPARITAFFWISYNNNKRGVTLNLESAEGQAILIKMVKEADFLLESYPPGYLDTMAA